MLDRESEGWVAVEAKCEPGAVVVFAAEQLARASRRFAAVPHRVVTASRDAVRHALVYELRVPEAAAVVATAAPPAPEPRQTVSEGRSFPQWRVALPAWPPTTPPPCPRPT